jgi:hypothetical protein
MGPDAGHRPGARDQRQRAESFARTRQVHQASLFEDFDGTRTDHVQVVRRRATLDEDRGTGREVLDQYGAGDVLNAITFEAIEGRVTG